MMCQKGQVRRHKRYGTLYGVKRTTVYLPEELKTELERASRLSGKSEAELIRLGIRKAVADIQPRPRIPLFSPGRGDIASRIDDLLAEFGQD